MLPRVTPGGVREVAAAEEPARELGLEVWEGWEEIEADRKAGPEAKPSVESADGSGFWLYMVVGREVRGKGEEAVGDRESLLPAAWIDCGLLRPIVPILSPEMDLSRDIPRREGLEDKGGLEAAKTLLTRVKAAPDSSGFSVIASGRISMRIRPFRLIEGPPGVDDDLWRGEGDGDGEDL